MVTAALAGVDLRGLAAICAEIRERTASRTPMMIRMMIRGWTGRCRWTPRWTAPG